MRAQSPIRRIAGCAVLWLAVAGPASAQIDLSGQLAGRFHEDQEHRVPGPELGDYLGLPINDAARLKADSWDASILSLREHQAKPHPSTYSLRGPANIRITKVFDAVTQETIGYEIFGTFGQATRTIWLDGRAHPSEHAEHTWAGFSTGAFHNGELTVTTTHMKLGVIQKVGVFTSPYSVMTEHFFRHGTLMTSVTVIEDPIYLEEPFIRTQTWVLNPNQNVAQALPWEPVDELAGKQVGWVPHYPLGTRHTEPAETYGIPFEATLGGANTTYPEYQRTIEQLRSKP